MLLEHKTFCVMADGTEETVYVEFDFAPGDSGKTSGPPEDCYPPEACELDITAVRNEAGAEISEWISESELEALTERVYDDHVSWYPQAQEQDWEDRCEREYR